MTIQSNTMIIVGSVMIFSAGVLVGRWNGDPQQQNELSAVQDFATDAVQIHKDRFTESHSPSPLSVSSVESQIEDGSDAEQKPDRSQVFHELAAQSSSVRLDEHIPDLTLIPKPDLPADLHDLSTESTLNDLLDEYARLDNREDKLALLGQLTDSAMTGNDIAKVEFMIVEKLNAADQNSKQDWLLMAAELGIRLPSPRNTMLEMLPTLSEPANLSLALNSLVPDLVPGSERDRVVNELNSYVQHPDPAVRSAALMSASLWGGEDQAILVEQALHDVSADVRHAAATSALMSNVQSNEIKMNLIDIMNNENENLGIRIQAHYALSRYPLSGQNYDSYFNFGIANAL